MPKPQSISLQSHANRLFGDLINRDDITEIAINRPGEIFIENGHWQRFENENITYDLCKNFSLALAQFNKDNISDTKPILSSVMPTDERVQVVMPPACEKNTISITIRKPSKRIFSLDEYVSNGFFSRIIKSKHGLSSEDLQLLKLYNEDRYDEFSKYAIKYGKTIVISGGTGSGKTTFMKALATYIPDTERIITIQDVEELFLKQPNLVNLYYPSEAKDDDLITPASLLKSCLRMKPDRILLAELRGAETYDFINVISSGHGGSLTSCHAGSIAETFQRLAQMVLHNRQGRTLPYEVINNLLYQSIDIIIQVKKTESEGRHISEIYFNPERKTGVTNEKN